MARLSGADRVGAHLARLGQGVRARIGRALSQAGARVADEARARFAAASPDGSERAEITVVRRGDAAVDVVATFPGAEAREFGTSRSAAKPFLRPAAEAKRADVAELIARATGFASPTQETD
ncbi:hypothetical protein [Inquilinus sp.]|jgi:hypothetical protein|uniref:hypothetical protein n=1 Tax=Inquilinus sp. TaxID=1932117 RepID=UPI003782D3B3